MFGGRAISFSLRIPSPITSFPEWLLLLNLLNSLLVTFCSPVRVSAKDTQVSTYFLDFDNVGVDVEARPLHQTKSVTKSPMLLYVLAFSDASQGGN